jgi:hypothetical protein
MLMPPFARSRGTPAHLKVTLPMLKKTDLFLLGQSMIAMTTPKTIAAMRNIMGAQMPYRTVLANFMVSMTNADEC